MVELVQIGISAIVIGGAFLAAAGIVELYELLRG